MTAYTAKALGAITLGTRGNLAILKNGALTGETRVCIARHHAVDDQAVVVAVEVQGQGELEIVSAPPQA